MWSSSQELLETIHDAHERLRNNQTDALTAHAEARLLGAATRVMAISLEHARLTNRLKEGDATLPVMMIQAAQGQPAIDVKATQPMIEQTAPAQN